MNVKRRARCWHERGSSNFRFVEFLTVLVIIGIVISYLFSGLIKPRRVAPSECKMRLKQIGIGFRLFANDHDGKLPMQVSDYEGGTREYTNNPFLAWRHFKAAGDDLVNPKVLLCPFHIAKNIGPTNFIQFTNGQFLSYFIGIHASETYPNSILSGDDDLYSNGRRIPNSPGFYMNASYDWGQRHPSTNGNLLFGDGSVETVQSKHISKCVREQFIR